MSMGRCSLHQVDVAALPDVTEFRPAPRCSRIPSKRREKEDSQPSGSIERSLQIDAESGFRETHSELRAKSDPRLAVGGDGEVGSNSRFDQSRNRERRRDWAERQLPRAGML